ncbi:MAG: glycosyltransferase family 4 protein [Terriglobia bacterium]
MDKLRIVYVTRRAVGGMLTHLIDLADSLPRDQYEVLLIAPPSDRVAARKGANFAYVEIDIRNNVNPMGDLVTALRYRAAFKRFRPHILHMHGNKAAYVARLAAWGLPIPVQLVTVHNRLRYLGKPSLRRFVSTSIERSLTRQTDTVISVSNDLARDLTEVEKLPSEKVKVVHNGVDLDGLVVPAGTRKSVREELGFSEDETVVAMIARLAPQKAPHIFVEAAESVAAEVADESRPVRFLLVGDGPSRLEVNEQIQRSSLGTKMVRTGLRSDVPALLAAIDVFVLSSVWEGVPYILEEAMGAARPVVSTAVGGVPELVEDGKTGILVPPKDSRALSEGILRVVRDPGFAQQLGQAARARIEESFSVARMVEETTKIYEELYQLKKGERIVV